jgi:hypothetical protein
MVDYVATPSNPPISLIEKEELEEASLDVNVSRWLRKEELSRRVVHTRVDRSARDRRLSPKPHALTIYLKKFPAHGAALKRFEECHCQTWFSVMAIIFGYKAQSTPFPWSIEPNI